MPRFSVVVTTRNRPDLVVSSVQSVLEQNFLDFELIVSDNSDDEHASSVQRSLEPYLSDRRVKYIRPPKVLPMTPHWEWAVAHASGQYVGILTDRMVMRLYTLSAVDRALSDHEVDLICYERANLIEGGGFQVPLHHTDRIETKVISSTEVIQAFSESDFRRMDNPRFLNSFVSAALIAEFKQHYGSLFTGIAPDYGFLMRVLDRREQYHFITNPLLLKHSEDRSNGKSFTHMRKSVAREDFLAKMKSEQAEFLHLAPIPDDLVMITNLMAREYEIGRQNQTCGKFMPLNKQSFYNESSRQLLALEARGVDVKDLMLMVESYRNTNKLIAYKPTWKEWRRTLKAKAKRFFRLSAGSNVSSRRASGVRFSTMIEALREDYAVLKSNRLADPLSPYKYQPSDH